MSVSDKNCSRGNLVAWLIVVVVGPTKPFRLARTKSQPKRVKQTRLSPELGQICSSWPGCPIRSREGRYVPCLAYLKLDASWGKSIIGAGARAEAEPTRACSTLTCLTWIYLEWETSLWKRERTSQSLTLTLSLAVYSSQLLYSKIGAKKSSRWARVRGHQSSGWSRSSRPVLSQRGATSRAPLSFSTLAITRT